MEKQKFLLYIDDTGLNIKEKTSKILQNEIATHVGVLIQENAKDALVRILSELGKFLDLRYGSDEFHFTDIYNRKEPFDKIEINETKEIIEMFVEIFKRFSIEIIVSTINPIYFEDANPIVEIINRGIKAINLPVNEKSQSLFFTYTKAKRYIEETYTNPFISQIVCDEGIKKRGTDLIIPGTTTTLSFRSSEKDKLLQLADFAAWFLTRSKNIFDKRQSGKNLSDIDISILQIFSDFSSQYILPQTTISLDGDINYDEIFNSLLE